MTTRPIETLKETAMPNHPSIIARPTTTGFEGRYIHNDGHPEQRIPLLLDLYHRAYRHDIEAMTSFLVDAHPAGWSQLGQDPTVETGWINHTRRTTAEAIADHGFRCYCHGDRSDGPALQTETNTSLSLADWIYVLRTDGIEVIGASTDTDSWAPAGLIPWDTSSR